MKKVEFVQTAIDAGFPAPNGSGFTHGESVYIVSKEELDTVVEVLDRLANHYESLLADPVNPKTDAPLIAAWKALGKKP